MGYGTKTNSRQDKRKIVSNIGNRMIMVEDLVEKLQGGLVKQLIDKKDFSSVFSKKPEVCPHCSSDKIFGIEVMGAKLGALLWECDKCFHKYLKYTKDYTEKELKEASAYWTNPSDWGRVPKSQFN